MKGLLKVAVVTLSICYPFMVYWGLQNYDAKLLLPLLLIILALRWLTGAGVAEHKVVVVTLLGIVIIALVWGSQLSLKFYPVLMNLGFLTLFAGSLLTPTTIVERLARIKEPDLPPEAIVYTRKVTQIWSMFFLFNGIAAAITALWASDEVWMLYNGFIAYLLIGVLAGGEWLVRQRVKRG
jgi:uncharacterized membrane protein